MITKPLDFLPVAGLTIEQALMKAKHMSVKYNQDVFMNVNDIFMYIEPKTDIKEALASYQQKLSLKYEVLNRGGNKYEK